MMGNLPIELNMRLLAVLLGYGEDSSRTTRQRAERWARRHDVLCRSEGTGRLYTTPALLRQKAPHVLDRLIVQCELSQSGSSEHELSRLEHLI